MTEKYLHLIIRLTLTWDVFKFVSVYRSYYFYNRLTLTWDVFKLYRPPYSQLFLQSD